MRVLGCEPQNLSLHKPGSSATRSDALLLHVWVLCCNLSKPNCALVYTKSMAAWCDSVALSMESGALPAQLAFTMSTTCAG